eukprot:2528540-Amphidinium_carterae.1
MVVTEINNFHYCVQSCLHNGWNVDKYFNKQYYRWFEDIKPYESETGTIANHMKIATVIHHLKGTINQHLMLKGTKGTNTTTFDEVPGWISNYFNNIYIGVEEHNTIGGIKDQPKKPPDQPWWRNRWSKGNGKDKGKKKKEKAKQTKAKQKGDTHLPRSIQTKYHSVTQHCQMSDHQNPLHPVILFQKLWV